MRSIYYFCIFDRICFIKNLVLVVSLYKQLVEFLPEPVTCKIFLACIIFLDNLLEVFRWYKVTYLMLIMFEFSIVLGCLVIILVV